MPAKVSKSGSSKGGKKQKKDPNAPKRSLSAYMFFAKDKRQQIIASEPYLAKDVATVGKMIGEAWNKLDEKDKEPYEKKAQEDKRRYEEEKLAYESKKQKA